MSENEVKENKSVKEGKEAEQAKPFQEMIPQSKSKSIFLIIAGLIIVIAVMAFFLFRQKSGPRVSPQMKQMEQTVQKIQKLEGQIQERQDEVFSLLSDYKKKTGADLPQLTIMNLSNEQKALLEEKIRQEKDVSIKSLLQDILDRRSEIQELKDQVQKIEAVLPKPHEVERGENHYQIAMDFLINEKGLDKDKAMELSERTALFEPLVPGFKVWNFYSEDEYGTFVTQGSAPISPNQIQRKVKKQLVDARDKAISERDQLANDIAEMEKRRGELISQLDLLNQEKESMLQKMTEIDQQNEELQTKLNSLFFILDVKKNLESRGILKGGFLRSTKMQSVSPEQFTMSIDLRKDVSINISAAAFGLSKIKNVVFYPNFYKEDIDYSIKIADDNQTAVLTIVDIKKFRNERAVISIR